MTDQLKSTTYNEKSSFTADGVAYRRTFTDLPFAKEIFEILQRTNPMSDEAMERAGMSGRNLIPFFEARYLMTDKIIAEGGFTQIVELASGLSGRGMHMTQNPAIDFIEVDLAEKIALKQKIVAQIAPHRSNLHFIPGNVTEGSTFQSIAYLLRGEKTVIECAGLLRYLSRIGQRFAGAYIWSLAKMHGGIWITPDLEFREYELATPAGRERYEKMATETGIDVRPNLFEDLTDAVTFFEDLGFGVKIFLLMDIIDQLVSPARLGLTMKEVVESMRHRMTFVLTPR